MEQARGGTRDRDKDRDSHVVVGAEVKGRGAGRSVG